jgi:hypothetical protein
MHLLNEFHIISWKESIGAIKLPHPSPPAWVQLLYICDDLINIKGQFSIILWRNNIKSPAVYAL